MNIDKAMRLFANYLNATWNIVEPLILNRNYTSNENSRSDWIQANWELLVERKVLPLNDYLEVYGAGADFNGKSSRITDIEADATFFVGVVVDEAVDVLNNQDIRSQIYFFDRFVGFENGFYIDSSPIEYVLIQDENICMERVFSIHEVKFRLCRIRK